MRDLPQARLLLEMARKDLRALQGMDDPEVFDDAVFGFHVQQAAEKALKAWLALAGVEYPKTHDLRLLLQSVSAMEPEAGSFSDLREYNAFAVQFRYDASPPTDEAIPRKRATSRVLELHARVGHLLARAEKDQPEQA
ncbi:MAG: HEPN domain-containing protein [Candidatus Sumerlaeota bacterium]|nr:HEPN domain-containing protein [Candidatus Sumerlaeota bacterium]